MSTTHLLVLLTVLLALVVVLVLAAALIIVRQRLLRISEGLAALGAALAGVESEHLRTKSQLGKWVKIGLAYASSLPPKKK